MHSAHNQADTPRKDVSLLNRGTLAYLLQGKFLLANGHLPDGPRKVPADFSGICVASMDDPASDAQMLEYLQQLELRQVRMDYTYGDGQSHAARFLQQLLDNGFRVLLRLLPPPEQATRMELPEVAQEWREFVEQSVERFGDRLEAIEVGNTVNRRNWSGYRSFAQFMAAWRVAYPILRQHQVTIAGPNVTDFEPAYNKILLSAMAEEGILPDIHTNNLFVERALQPENYDRKIFGERWGFLHKLNLIKKARLLQRISEEFGIDRTWSPTAFWTVKRIERRFLAVEEKQADYLLRYMVLAAVSGGLGRAYWGPLVSQREGLVDDGTGQEAPHELVAHYGTNYGELENYRVRPAFHTFAHFNRVIAGALYKSRKTSARWLEVHEFESGNERVHVLWTGDNRGAELAALYDAQDLAAAVGRSRDGELLENLPDVVCDSPIYLSWPLERSVKVNSCADVFSGLLLDGNRSGGQYYLYQDEKWRGAVFAPDRAAADRLIESLHPDRLEAENQDNILRKARNLIWRVPHPNEEGGFLVAKKPYTLKPHKKVLERLKPTKATRSWNGATLLNRAGLHSPAPIAYFECTQRNDPLNNWYICEFAAGLPSVRACFEAYTAGKSDYQGITKDELFPPLAQFLLKLHARGVFFRDLAGGNILVRRQEDGSLDFSLIDTARAHFFSQATVINKRLSDLKRACYKLSWPLRIEFMEMYLQGYNKGVSFGWMQRLPFHYFDYKMHFKRFLKRRRRAARARRAK